MPSSFCHPARAIPLEQMMLQQRTEHVGQFEFQFHTLLGDLVLACDGTCMSAAPARNFAGSGSDKRTSIALLKFVDNSGGISARHPNVRVVNKTW